MYFRHFFSSDSLDTIESTVNDLMEHGLSEAQAHVLSANDSGLANRHLHAVSSISKRDVIRSGFIGAAIGAVFVAGVLGAGLFLNAQGSIGWLPYIVLSVVLFGFCVWEGGLFGIQVGKAEFRQFAKRVKNGEHILIVDVDERSDILVKKIVLMHDGIEAAGDGHNSSGLFIKAQENMQSFFKAMP